MNPVRYIVKPFTGNSQGGAKYLAWGGPGRDFEQKALVLSDNRQPSHRSSPELNQPSSESSTHASFNRLNQIQSSRRSSRRLNLIGSEFENETAEALVHAPVPLDIGAGNPSQPIGNDVCPDPASHKTMAKLALKNGKRTSRPSEVSIQIPFGAQSRHSSPEATGTKGRPVVPGSPSAKRRKTESSNGETNHLSSASPAPCRSKNQTAVTPASKVDARKISEGVAKSSISNSIAHPCQPQHPSTELHQRKRNATPVPSPQTVDLSVLLPRHKQDRTILIVRVAHSLEFQPLRLGDCMTLETFYAKVLGVWNVAEENVAKITVTFKWMSVEDSMRTMVMNRSQDACLTFLIGQVDDAPCWMDEKGKCILDVGIVLKE